MPCRLRQAGSSEAAHGQLLRMPQLDDTGSVQMLSHQKGTKNSPAHH